MLPAVSPYTTFCSGEPNPASAASKLGRSVARPMARSAPISSVGSCATHRIASGGPASCPARGVAHDPTDRSEEHTSELQSRGHLVRRRLLRKTNEMREL